MYMYISGSTCLVPILMFWSHDNSNLLFRRKEIEILSTYFISIQEFILQMGIYRLYALDVLFSHT